MRVSPLAILGTLVVGLAIDGLAVLRVEPPRVEASVAHRVDEQAIDLNDADAATLERLPRIGPTLAARIVAHRAEHGPFSSVESLVEVRGIGEATLLSIRRHVCVNCPAPALPPASAAR